MDRALREFRIRGVASNLQFLENVIDHPLFRSGECTTRFIDTTPELFSFQRRRDRGTKLLKFLGEVAVNGNPEMKGRALPQLPLAKPIKPRCDLASPPPPGTRDRLKQMGAEKFAEWMKAEQRVLLTDTTMRDAHQSLFATRMRTHDLLEIAPHYARMLPDLFSLECWGGATFDVALRFLKEDPWARLAQLRAAIPNVLFQMLLRASNAVGYTNYSDNVVRYFVQQAAKEGVDVFRRLRLAQLGGQHARGDGRGARVRRPVRGGDLLHRRPVRPGAAEVQPEVLRRFGEAAGEGRRPHPRHQGHGRRLPPARGA
jgi:Pyruvate carboxylase